MDPPRRLNERLGCINLIQAVATVLLLAAAYTSVDDRKSGSHVSDSSAPNITRRG
jgi:hypothetical protein